MAQKPQSFDKNNLEYGMIDSPDHPEFDRVYDCYKKCFPLETEQESKENFMSFMEENADKSKSGREMWVYVKDKTTGEVIGASNFDAFMGDPKQGIDGTVQGIYMFVAKEHREQGLFDVLINLREQAAGQYLRNEDPSIPNPPRLATFAEQNNSLMMTPAQYIEDSQAAIDQNERREIFEKRGFRTLKMRYVQPALEAGGEPCDYLDFVAKIPPEMTSLPSAVVRKHMDQFFEKSFPEGTSLDMPELAGMKRDLQQTDIELEPRGKFGALRDQGLNVDSLKALPEEHHDTLIGHLRPELVRNHYGKGVAIDHAMESAARVDEAIEHQNQKAHNFTPKGGGDSYMKRVEGPREGWSHKH